MSKWYQAKDNDYPGVIMSSRVRLARNLVSYPFPNQMTPDQGLELVKEISETLNKIQVGEKLYSSRYMDQIPSLDKVALMEEHIISPAFINSNMPRGIVASEDEGSSIMINEEDHLRIQAMTFGADLKKVYEEANQLDDYIEEHFDYAYDEEFGYLTSCPTNLGTGLRASYMIHVPALEASGQLRIILDAIGKFGITFRGIYGESSEPVGSVFQISNQVTMGFNEKEIMDNLNSVTMQIVDQEMKVREKLLTEKPLEFEDSIYRSYGLLKYARVISSKETMTLLSDIKLGFELGILKADNYNNINIFELMTNIQPANLQKIEKRPLDVGERDIARANYIRNMIPSVK